MLREPPSRNQMRSTARNNKRFDPCLGITNLNRQSHSKRRFHRITITTKLETLDFIQYCGATCFSRRGDSLSCASSCHLSNTIQRSTTVQNCVSFRHGHGDTHEVRTLLDFLRRPCFESSFSTFCRRRNRPRFNTPGLRDTSTNRRSGKSHTAFGLRHVDISLRTIFLPVTFFTTQSTLGSRHEALFQGISFTFHGTLATTLAFASLAFATFSTLVSFALALVGCAFAVFSFDTEWLIIGPHSQCC